MRDLLLNGEPEVAEGRIAQPVHVKEEVVKVQSLGAMRRPRGPQGSPIRAGQGPVPFQGLSVVLVSLPVELSTDRADQGWVEEPDRVVRVHERRVGVDGRAGLRDLSAEVRVDRPVRVLELGDRPPRDLFDDRLQIPARPAAGRAVGAGLVAHGRARAVPGV